MKGVEKTILLGGRGQLGTALRGVLPGPAISPTHDEFDIVDGDINALLTEERPTLVVNCAAFHNVDRCEREPVAAFVTNAVAVDRMSAECAKRDIVFVTISTDYVFSGDARRAYREHDATDPRTSYGVSKLAGEQLTRRHGSKHLIVRTSGVFGTTGTSSKGYTLIDKVLDQAEHRAPTRMVADMTFSPSYAPHVARAIHDLISARAFGTHHVTNVGSCTWYEFVKEAFAKAGLGDAPLEATTYAAMGHSTQRPMYSPLENTTFARVGIAPMPTWQDALDEFLTARRTRLANVTN